MSNIRVCICLFLLALIGIYIHQMSPGQPVPTIRPLSEFPYQIGDWRGTPVPLPLRVREILGVDDYISREYRKSEGQVIELYVGYYACQEQDKLIHSPNNCFLGSGWQPVGGGIESLVLTEGTTQRVIPVRQLYLRKGLDELLVLYWYQTGDRYLTSDYYLKLQLIWGALISGKTNAAFIRFSAPVNNGDLRYTLALEKDFIQLVIPVLDHFLPFNHQ